ncbi:MAG: membrane dipeptidase [Candidatus Pacebacteria bacterium]|nr:membrane dipeptidase [Candidatus Paceibacterota bacterium]
MNIPRESFFADSMAFVGLQGQPPKFGLGCRPRLALAHLTSAPPFAKDFMSTMEAHKAFIEVALANPGVEMVRVAETVNHLSTVNTGMLFGLQHTPAGITYADLHSLFTAGIRTMSLAYEGDTEYGGGFKSGGRLKGRGEKLIRWMADIGFILDLSHAGHSTARNALRYIRQERLPIRVMASHSGCYGVYPHQRNFPDDILESIASADGYLGIPLITFFLGRKDTNYLEEFSRHVTHALSVMGKGRVGIGSDCLHFDMTMEQAEKHFGDMTKMLKSDGTFGEFFPDRPPELIKHGNNMFKILEHALLSTNARAFDPGILGQNFKDFLSRSLPQV